MKRFLRPKPSPAASTNSVRRRVDIATDASFASYADYQALYMNRDPRRLIPNTEIWRGPNLVMQVNALGCKGPDLVPGEPAIAFFGDSTTLCVANESWCKHVDVPGYQILNAGIEGIEMQTMADRYDELKGRAPIGCAVVCAGWHNLIYRRHTEKYWEKQLSRFHKLIYIRNTEKYWEKQLSRFLSDDHATAYWTAPSPLTEEFRERGIVALMNTAEGANIDDDYFNFLADDDPDTTLIPLIDALERFNAFVVEFSVRNSATLVDLAAFLRPARYEDATKDFFDACHMRPRAYARIGEFVGGVLRGVLPSAESAPTTAAFEAVEAVPGEDLRQNIYPLW